MSISKNIVMKNTLNYNMSPLDLENWDFLAIHRAFCCCVFSLSGFYTAARCDQQLLIAGN